MSNKLTVFFTMFSLGVIAMCPAFGQPTEADALFKKAEVLYRNFDYSEAIAAYDQVIITDPEYVKAYLQRGFCKNITKDFEGAIADFTKVIEMDPSNKFAYLSRGSAHNKTGEYAAAIEDFNKVLEIDPKEQEAFNNRGFSKKLSGDKQGACEDWNTSKKLGNEEARIILKNNGCK